MPSRSKKQDRLCEERNAAVKEIPEEYIEVMQADMDATHRIYYKKTRNKIELRCSLTEQEDTFYRDNEDPFDQRKTMQQDPKHNDFGRCPICGRYGKFISPGKAKRRDHDILYFSLYEPWDGDGLVIRSIEVERVYENLYSDYRQVSPYREGMIEYARTFLKIGQIGNTDYKKYDGWNGRTFWDYKNISGMTNIQIYEGRNLGVCLLQKKPWSYAMDLYYRMKNKPKSKREFLKAYAENPEVELIYKTGMTALATGIIKFGSVRKYKGKKIWEKYGVTKEHWNYIRDKNYGVWNLEVFQENDQKGYGCTLDQIEWFKDHMRRLPSKTIMDVTSPTKLIHYLEKQTKRENGYGSISTTYRHYEDYINTMQQMGYDLTNTVYLYPKDLRAKHNEAAHRLAVQLDQKKKQEKNEQYKNIAKNYKKICKQYAYEDGDFLIRPASSAGEIIEEGRELHHCVGGDNYLSSHNKGNSYILLMRHVNTPGIPFCTVEIKDSIIRQWYEAHDQKPDKEVIQQWLDKYVKHLKEEEHGTNRTELAAG